MRAFIAKVLFELNGFNPVVVYKLGSGDQFNLISLSIWGVVGTLLSSFSVAYIVHYATESLASSIISFFLCLFILISLHVLLVTSSNMELTIKSKKRQEWLPSKFRSLSYLMVGLLFSQPIVLTCLSITNALESNASIQNLDLQIESIKSRYSNYSALKHLKLTQLQTYRNIADKNAPNVTTKYVKKAILIDNGDASKSIKTLKDKLQTLGFEVTSISKIFGADLDLEIKSYYEKINTGDISIFVYRGPSKVTSDNSLEMIQAKSGLFSHSVDVDSLISIIANKKTLASYFLFSLPPDDNVSKDTKKINWENHENTYIGSVNNDKQGELISAFVKNLENSVELNSALELTTNALSGGANGNLQLLQTSLLKFPIFLSWNQSSFFKEMNKNEMEGLIPATDYCKTYASFEQNTFAKCLEAEESIVNSELQFIDEMRKKNVQSIEVVKARKLQVPSIVMNYTGWVKKHIFLTLFFSMTALVIVAGGYIVRDRFSPNSIVKYETKVVQLSRISLHQQFKAYRVVVRKIRNRFTEEGEHFDNSELQHPLYQAHIKERKQKQNSSGDDLYKALLEAIKNIKQGSV